MDGVIGFAIFDILFHFNKLALYKTLPAMTSIEGAVNCIILLYAVSLI